MNKAEFDTLYQESSYRHVAILVYFLTALTSNIYFVSIAPFQNYVQELYSVPA